jgi:glucose/arabinose dehydrogenase
MLVPGFTVQELPIKLSNINNLRFNPRGELTALGYNGRVHILRDTTGDGLEDHALPFWDKDTLRVPVGMAWSQEGLYVSSQGKVSLLKDTDGNGKADTEEIIASGWPATDVVSGGVDASAVTLDAEGNIYFGLLTADYSNPYRVKDGVSHYDINGKRGTIQKWRRATRQLETIATGIRVPYALAFNRFGDLFVTDQEGETWCPNGNPLDELNHIIPGRNYGFPPRHEKYLPDLVSEGPVVAFGPQHQSACGFVFNERKPNQKPFGPAAWENDAFVTGESRGKIWRVPLSKSGSGYSGRAITIARLNM